ncbi:MAG: N-6 DNA methylase [Prevotella sp.]|nr:N-6 DNA methylase [Prevotella sp.]
MVNYKEIIESRYNRQNWQLLLHDIFGNKVKFWVTPSEVSTSSPFAHKALWLGTITLSDNQTIAVYEVELAESVDIERNRRGIRDMLLTAWRNNGNAGAFMFCYRKNESVLRFSYVSEAWTFTDDGTYQKESTDTKRFTYLLGEGHRSRTAIQQFEKLRDSDLSLKDLTKAFSVEAVSDMFFRGYKQQYEDIIFYVTGKRMVKVSNKWEERQEGSPNTFIMQQFSIFDNPEKAIRDYVKKLMGRLVFLQYLQKKGWLGVPVNAEWGAGDAEFVQHLFENSTDKDHFVDNVLEALFDDLNSERANDLVSSAVGRNIRVPYLNGGLFEREATDETEFPLPGNYMKSLLDFFSSYNFTIDENDPDDAEVGVDPEMLGRIFENLLEDNKDKGAFYTPKEIVTYMCRESLIAYLQTDVEDEATKEAIRQFVTTHDSSVLGNITDDIDQRLKDVKICDPAIGSGAFPMGLLKELFLCRTAIEGFEQSKSAEIKKHIIQNNIYGVDIERGAVDIARLRFWLSLIVDEETPHALPNLDFKIMQGNSLIEQYKGVDLSTMTEKKADSSGMLSIFDDMLDVYRKQLRDKLEEYYECADHRQKPRLRTEISKIVKQELAEQSINVDFSGIDLAGNNQFFLWHTWFNDVFSKGGFDIVIGNPPYISTATQIANPILSDQRNKITASKSYKTLYSKWDIYVPFMERSMCLLANNGVFTMIVPYPLTNQIYAKKIREYIVNEYNLFEFVDLNGTKIFDNATVSSCIPFVRRANMTEITIISHIYDNRIINKDFKKRKKELVPDQKSFIWYVDKESRNTNRFANMHVLGDYCYVSKGMVLYSEEGLFTNKDLISETPDIIHCRKYIEAKDIESYEIQRIRYIEYDTDRVPEKVSRPTFRELYNVPKLITNCLGELKVTVDIEDHYICQQGLRIAVLWKDIKNVDNKSITTSIKKYSSLSRTEMEELSSSINLKYILGIMASKLGRELLTLQRAGDYHIVPEHIRNIPIAQATKEEQKAIIQLVDVVLAKKRETPLADTSALESEIDRLVYQLYGLTYDEVLIIDPNPPFSQEEYDNAEKE